MARAQKVVKCYFVLLRSSHRRCSVRKSVFRNFAKFTGKHLCQNLFFNKVLGLRRKTLLKKKNWRRCFPVNFETFLRTPFLQNTSGQELLHTYWLIHFNINFKDVSLVITVIIHHSPVWIFHQKLTFLFPIWKHPQTVFVTLAIHTDCSNFSTWDMMILCLVIIFYVLVVDFYVLVVGFCLLMNHLTHSAPDFFFYV